MSGEPKLEGEGSMTIVTLALNEAMNLPGLKESIDQLRYEAGDVELLTVLVDTGSSDATVELARQLGFDVVVERPGSNIPSARNAGARATDSKWIGFIDADCRPQRGWLSAAVDVLRLDELSIAGWTVDFPPDPTWVQRAWKAHWEARLDEYHGDHLLKGSRALGVIHGGNMALTRRVFDELNGFDERYQTGEDSDLVFRGLAFSIVGAPGMVVVHLGEPATLVEFFRQQLWHATGSDRDRDDHGAGRTPRLFAVAFISALFSGIGLLACAVWLRRPKLIASSIVPLAIVLGVPALRTARRARQARLWAPLAVLYGAYGLARSIKLLGGTRSIRSWRSEASRYS